MHVAFYPLSTYLKCQKSPIRLVGFQVICSLGLHTLGGRVGVFKPPSADPGVLSPQFCHPHIASGSLSKQIVWVDSALQRLRLVYFKPSTVLVRSVLYHIVYTHRCLPRVIFTPHNKIIVRIIRIGRYLKYVLEIRSESIAALQFVRLFRSKTRGKRIITRICSSTSPVYIIGSWNLVRIYTNRKG